MGLAHAFQAGDAPIPGGSHGEFGVDEHVAAPAQRNRHLLLGVMSAAGWDFYRNEWWHYQLFQARARYPLISDTSLPERMMGESGFRSF